MKSRILLIAGCLLLTSSVAALAQEKKADPPAAPAQATASAWPAADPKDVASLDSMVAAIYGVISGPAGDAELARVRISWPRQSQQLAVGGGRHLQDLR